MRKCHLNTCPVGIATQDKELRKKFKGKPEHVVNYLFMVAKDLRMIMAELGFKTVDEMIGRVDCLETDQAIDHWKRSGLDFSGILQPAKKIFDNTEVYNTQSQDHGLDKALDNSLIERCRNAITNAEKISFKSPILNINRTVGTMLSNEVAKVWESNDLPEDTIEINFEGSAGQSFAAWLVKGIKFKLEGDANDYVGKGLSGGKLIIHPPKDSLFKAEDNILLGNVALYGATEGEAYFRGIAAERFCVRNSGATVVVEGIGDHGCEYMTGGKAVILGPTGRNFGAGMSGGIAYIYNKKEDFEKNCNQETYEIEDLIEEDLKDLKFLIQKHFDYTESTVAQNILSNWEKESERFVKVMPTDYKRVLNEIKSKKQINNG
jgi:glutamate synthase (NADPH/NADH) large chain